VRIKEKLIFYVHVLMISKVTCKQRLCLAFYTLGCLNCYYEPSKVRTYKLLL